MSLLYITQNALLSCMLVADEWSGFAADRKTLRVSAPIGIQRSQYSLSMPMRYGIPMMIVFAIEHWLLSQSTFIVRANRVSWNGDYIQGWTTAGYSFIPCLTGKAACSRPRAKRYFHWRNWIALQKPDFYTSALLWRNSWSAQGTTRQTQQCHLLRHVVLPSAQPAIVQKQITTHIYCLYSGVL